MMRLLFYSKILLVLFSVASCDGRNTEHATAGTSHVKRIGMVTGVKPEKIDYYKKLHAETWEGVMRKIRECNIRNYSIYLKKLEGKYFLFSYYEYVGDDYEGDMKKIAADTTTQRWWKETDPCQLPLPEAAVQGRIWTPIEEVFHTD